MILSCVHTIVTWKVERWDLWKK